MKVKFYLLLLAFFLIIKSASSQKLDSLKNNDKIAKETLNSSFEKPPKPNQHIYGEFLGPGLGLSVNYDTRFNPGKTGFGIRAGAGLTFGLTLTAAADYIIGNNDKRSFLELGGGSTYYILDGKGSLLSIYNQNRLIPETYIYYRFQDFDTSPYVFRVGITQHYYSEGNYTIARYLIPGISLGYAFYKRK